MSRESRAQRRQIDYEDFLVEQYEGIDMGAFREMEDYFIALGHMKPEDRVVLPPNVLTRLGVVELATTPE